METIYEDDSVSLLFVQRDSGIKLMRITENGDYKEMTLSDREVRALSKKLVIGKVKV